MFDLLLNVPAFFATTFLLAMVPGQGSAMILRQSILSGRKAAMLSVLGNSTGLFIWGTTSSIGLSAIFARSQTAYSILKWSGVAFLFFLSVKTLLTLKNEFGRFDLQSSGESNPWAAYRLGLITNLTNVKAAVFAVAFIPEFVPKDFSLGWGIFIFGCLWPLFSTPWYAILVWTVDKSSVWIQKPQVRRTLTAISAFGIAMLALGLALSSK